VATSCSIFTLFQEFGNAPKVVALQGKVARILTYAKLRHSLLRNAGRVADHPRGNVGAASAGGLT
jgi:hypothetical protein